MGLACVLAHVLRSCRPVAPMTNNARGSVVRVISCGQICEFLWRMYEVVIC